MTQLLLMPPHYPNSPGAKRNGTSETSAQAIAPHAETLREKCMVLLKCEPMTSDEAADRLGVSILSIRPRFSECLALGLIKDSGKRRKNLSGVNAVVWETTERLL